jgi:hypothetical protein
MSQSFFLHDLWQPMSVGRGQCALGAHDSDYTPLHPHLNGMPRVLEARRRSLPTTRRDRESSHWRRSLMLSAMGGRGEDHKDSGISYVERKRKCQGQSAASRRRAAGGVSPHRGKRNSEGEKSLVDDSFYKGRGEREGEIGSTCRRR